ncbi:MAG: hypothetical protein WCW84_07880 [Sulfurimonas sp.]
MQQFNEKDKVIYQGNEFQVKHSNYGNFIQVNGSSIFLKNIRDNEITLKEKFYPKMHYAGAEATVLACVQDGDSIIYLELVGQEDMVKSITSVIMQGRIKQNDEVISYTEGHFAVHRGGTKRMLKQIGDGYAHSILYHTPSVSDTNFSVLLGRTDHDVIDSFKSWLLLTNPLPYPPELAEEILNSLAFKGKIVELDCYGEIRAIKMEKTLGDNEYEALQEIILEVSLAKGVMNKYTPKIEEPIKKQASLPKSPLLYPRQVQAIYDKLATMPKTYELDGISPKPVGIKLFNSSMTAYVTEADRGSEDDEFEGSQTQAFGYFYNESYGEGEWGYINVDELIECGFEMDLYFEDQFIDDRGNIIEEIAA